MKKILILFLLSFTLFGCVNQDSDHLDETEPDPIIYETTMFMRTYKPVHIYDTIYLNCLTDLSDFQFKSLVFDYTKIESLHWGTIRVRSSKSAMIHYLSDNETNYTSSHSFTFIDSKTFVNAYLVDDFSSYLDSTFLDDILKLENSEVTADDIFNQYGTHVIMCVRLGYRIDMALSIESNDLKASEYNYIKDILLNRRPISFPIMDANYLAYEAKSRITFEIKTTQNSLKMEDILNDYESSSFPLSNMFDLEDIIPLYNLLERDNTLYPLAVAKLLARYNELFPTS